MPVQHTGSREQLQLIHWDPFIASDNPVRVIDAFVDLLDLEQLGFTLKGKSREGRPAFSSGTLLKLYFYGYLNRCRSSRQLMRAARTNVELFWLLREAKPCYKTIADFRKDNTTALKKTFSSLNQFLRGEGLFQGDTIAVDRRSWGFHYTLLKTKEKVGAEMALIFTGYNVRRSMSIFGVRELLQRLKAAGPHFFALKRAFLSLLACFLCSNIQNKLASYPKTSAPGRLVWAV